MVNPFEWLFGQIDETLVFLGSLSAWQLLGFFWPALFLDMPRFVLGNVLAFFHEIYFPARYGESGFARQLRGAEPPLVSVVVAGYNESKTIETCLRSLSENNYPNKEIIVIDDGSTDGMDQVCRRIAKKYGILYYRHEERAGKPASVNHGLAVSRGEFVLVGDADTTFDRDAIFQSLLPFADPRVGAVSANIRVRNVNASWLTRLQAIEYNTGVGVGRRFLAMLGVLTNVSGAFGMFRRSVLLDVGGNDVGPGEDFDATVKVRKAGWKIAFAPLAICMTNVPVTVRQFVRQRIRWDQTTVRFRMRKHRDLFFDRWYDWKTTLAVADTIFYDVVLLAIRVPYYGLLFYLHPNLTLKIVFATWIFYFVGDCIQFAVALALSERKREDWWLIPMLPFFVFFSFGYSVVRGYAYVDEWLFYSSYRDRYIPDKVQREAALGAG